MSTTNGDIYGSRNSPYTNIWNLSGRAAGYISHRLDLATWDCETKDYIHITVNPDSGNPTLIFGVYCEPYQPRNWHTALDRLHPTPPTGHVLVLGDFNFHHPLWAAHHRRSEGVDRLLQVARQWDLQLRRPDGTPTWGANGLRSHHRKSILDFTWKSTNTTAKYTGAESWPGSDHTR